MKTMLRIICLFAGLACAAGLLPGCGDDETTDVSMEGTEMVDITGKSVLMIIACKDFRDEELIKPKAVLEEKGVTVKIACSTLDPVGGILETTALPDLLIGDVNVDDYIGVIFVGGSGATEYFDDPVAHKIAIDTLAKGKVLGAICIAPATLARAGVLKGVKATCHPSQKDELKKHGAKFTGTQVEVDGKIVTASGPDVSKIFGEYFADTLRGL